MVHVLTFRGLDSITLPDLIRDNYLGLRVVQQPISGSGPGMTLFYPLPLHLMPSMSCTVISAIM